VIDYPASLKAVGGARSGVAPVNLLDVQDVNGNLYFWSDRPSDAPPAIAVSGSAAADPPVPLAAGQSIAWAFPTTVAATPGPGDGSATGTLSSGTIVMTGESPTAWVVQWGSFSMPALPPNARIDAIWPVLRVTAQGDSTFTGATAGAADFISDYAAGITFDMPSGNDFDGQYTTPSSLGADASVLAGLNVSAHIARSLLGAFFEQLDVSFVGLAIYYSASDVAGGGIYKPWLLDVPQFAFHRSLQTDTGSFLIQNVSGDTLSRDAERLLRASTLEGALFVYRLWQADAEAAWLEIHGMLTVEDVSSDRITLKGTSLINAARDDTPLETYSETCQIDWAGRRCGSTQSTECSYSFQSCQVVERIMVALNNYEKNFGEAAANVTVDRQPNRRRKI